MKLRRRLECVFAALLLVGMLAGPVLAQDQDSAPPPPANAPVQQQNYPGQQGDPAQGGQQQQDPPGRVARVQYMSGQVSMQPGGVNDWVAASTNRPLTTADRLWTDKDSRAELNVGDGFLRMNSETSVTLSNVGDNTVQIELDQGTLVVTVRHLERGEVYEVDTPNFAFTMMKSGVYRFDVYPSQDESWVTVRSGYGEATGKAQAVRVNSGMQVRFRADNSLQHTAYAAPARDGFEDWVQVRDKRLDDSVSARYVSPGVIGYQDLDTYGHWTTAPTYGAVWVPNSVPVGWAPYRFGHWAWIAPWGWTWVDDAPWGFAPFHYGRWISYGGGWGWAPGPYGGYWNPYYAPALVGWVGGAGFGVGFGFGWGGFGIGVGFGWYPLGWGQPFYPRYCGWGHGGWYRGGGYVSNAYFRNVNITNTRITNINNVTNNYYNNNLGARNMNPVMRNGVTSASREAFISGAAVNKVGGAVPVSALARAQAISSPNVTPTKSSVLGGQAPRTSGVPSNAAGRSVVTNARPPAGPARFAGNETANARGNNVGFAPRGTPTGNTASSAVRGPATEAPRANTADPGATQNAPHMQPGAANSQAAGNGEVARANIPQNPTAGHYVPRPPSAGGMTSPRLSSSVSNSEGTAAHGVSRPPSSNDGFARPNGTTANGGITNGRTAATVVQNNASAVNNQHMGANSSVPRPPQSAQVSRPATTPQYSAPSRQSAPAGRAAPQSNSGSHGSNSSSGPGASMAAPRPPAGYSYHAPTYSASPVYGGGRSASSYSGGNNRSAYQSYSAPSRSYSSAPAYSASRSYGSSPTSSGRSSSYSAPHYSAPHYSGGGGGGYHASGGGGSSHGGGGGHQGR